MKVHVEVTAEDIGLGCRNDASGAKGGCMVHRAFMRATEGAFAFIEVDYKMIFAYELNTDGHPCRQLWRAEMLAGVGDRIFDFDEGDMVEPFAFDIEIPTEVTA